MDHSVNLGNPWQPAVFAAAVIRPPNLAHHLPQPTAVLVFIRVLSPSVLEPLGRSVGLSGFVISDAAAEVPGRGFLPLEGSGHALTWAIPQPGTALIHTVIPPLAVALLLIAVAMALFARHAMRASAGIDRSHRQLAASKAALETSEERFKAVAEAASDWIWETDAQLHLTYLSARFAELTGHAVQAWLQRPITELLSCDTCARTPSTASRSTSVSSSRWARAAVTAAWCRRSSTWATPWA